MGTLTLQNMRDYVRGVLDLSVDDLADSILDVFLREGYRKTSRYEPNWPFYTATATLTTSGSTAAYALAGLSTPLERVAAVIGDYGPLDAVDRQQIRQYYNASYVGSSRPTWFTTDYTTLTLYPTPDAAYSLRVEGFRAPNAFPTASGGVMDLPADFDEAVCQWALSRAYGQQDDPNMAAFHATEWEKQLSQLRDVYTPYEDSPPLILNRGLTTGPWPNGRLKFGFEG